MTKMNTLEMTAGNVFTGVAISSDCLRIQFLFQRHGPIVKNPRTIGCDVFLTTFQQKSYS